ncbi:MAG: Shikimate dehydrogenase (NADP(+)) [Chlamydiales bacterium]|nr:Shikimate dehydrogenase (NADP(+)) [Chlamydiales bacterium]
MLCAPIRRDSLDTIEQANQKADLIELRLDLFEPKDLRRLRLACQKPVIFKLNHFDVQLLSYQPDYIDLPFDHEVALPVPRISSFHDFHSTPDLHATLTLMQQFPADYYKIATTAQSTLDALRMLQFVREKKIIGLCMGEMGEITRILAPVFGVPWTYAPLEEEELNAPGQILLDELVDVYRYRTLSPKSALFGLVGDPVRGSQSDKKHNVAFEQRGLDAVYVKMEIRKEEVSLALPLLQKLGFRGLSVTMPLKEQIRPGEVINTIGFEEGQVCCWNTDGGGALDALECKGSVAGKQIVILGAGGAAKAIAKEAVRRGAYVRIANRTVSQGILSLEEFASQGYDILINCTPLCPIDTNALLENRIVMDIITRPEITPLLEAAAAKGCQVVTGMEMWTQQAKQQYSHWFGW